MAKGYTSTAVWLAGQRMKKLTIVSTADDGTPDAAFTTPMTTYPANGWIERVVLVPGGTAFTDASLGIAFTDSDGATLITQWDNIVNNASTGVNLDTPVYVAGAITLTLTENANAVNNATFSLYIYVSK